MKPEVSIILPVHNGVKYLANCIDSVERNLRDAGIGNYEIIIAEDGSADGTGSLARKITSERRNVRLFQCSERLGRGNAIERAARASLSEKVIYLDVDLASGLDRLVEIAARLDDFDIVLGSRYAPGAHAKRRPLRRFLSLSYLALVNAFFSSNITDYQCGFKGFRKSALLDVSSSVKDKRWFWDTELILEAIAANKRIAEVPVAWVESDDTTVSITKDTTSMFSALIRYKLRRLAALFSNANNAGAKRQQGPAQHQPPLNIR